MTDPTAPEPLPPDIVDELLSALADSSLDNQVFDDAARDHGLTPDAARARLDATPGTAERARAMETARAEVAAVPPLDELTRRRLVGAALKQPHERGRAGRWLLAGGGVAAAILVVVGLAKLSLSTGDTSAKNSSAPASGKTSATAAPKTPKTGVVNDERQLRDFVDGARRAVTAQRAAPKAVSPPTSNAESYSTSGQAHNLEKTQRDTTLKVRPNCPVSIAASLHLTPPPSLTASVIHNGKPATVLVFTKNTGVLGVLFDPANCHIFISTFVQ